MFLRLFLNVCVCYKVHILTVLSFSIFQLLLFVLLIHYRRSSQNDL